MGLGSPISIETACERILGVKAARGIIADMGLHWAIAAAVALATTDQDGDAIAELRAHCAAEDQREAASARSQQPFPAKGEG